MTPLRTLPFLLALVPGLLLAQDDRDRSTPTANQFLTGQSTTDLDNLANSGWRVTDLEVESISPWSFTVAVVANTGAYFKDWRYFAGLPGPNLSLTFVLQNMRPIDLEVYVQNGFARFVSVMVSNTGADQKNWTWSPAAIGPQQGTGQRTICAERYTLNGQPLYAVAAIENTGADYYSWNAPLGVSSSLIDDRVDNFGYRIYDLDRVGTSSFDAILLQDTSHRQWYYFGKSAAQVRALMEQNLARVIDIERHTVLVLGTRYDVVMIDNANGVERLARQSYLDAPLGSVGAHGFFLKAINGPVLAAMRPDALFEPADAMTTLYHAHAMKRVSTGPETLTMSIGKPAACGVAGANQSLESTLRQMMEGDDDMATLAISNQFGLGNLGNTAAALGMTNTAINYTIGCSGPVPPSTMTLRDLSLLHEQVANGFLGGQKAKFYELMQEDLSSFPSPGAWNLDARIDAEAATLAMPTTMRNAFKAAVHLVHKHGGTSWFQGGTQHYYHAGGGWLSVPFMDSLGQVTSREYTFGAFNHDFLSQEAAGRDAMLGAERELVWDRVLAALLSWNDQHVVGSFVSLSDEGCPGTAGTPVQSPSGVPELTRFAHYQLSSAPANAIYVALFGFSTTDYQGIPLPFDLAPIGAPDCILHTSIDGQVAGYATASGTATVTIAIGTDPATIGVTWYSQYLVLDPPANTWGATLSNAWQTTVGGWL